ncbi:MAG: T9SS type A sorting domain-containing protein [Ignavibacteria bacterium]|jgi:hypothetical protein|nr:T9SS type A sorting domain-containing protein [Ignavibacteria bacterium]
MKNFLTLFAIAIIAFLIFTGQKLDNNPVWNTPQTIVWTPADGYSNYIPLNNGMPNSTVTNYYYSPSGIYAVGPNFRPYQTTATQSEIHAYYNPNVPGKFMVGWNSYGPSFYGTGFCHTSNSGANWNGSNTLPGLATNSGDPSVAITSNGYIFMNAIGSSASQQLITWSSNGGVNWAPYVLAGQNQSGSTADKNHMGIDDKSTSPYYNNLYIAWTDFSAAGYPAKLVRSTNLGVNWAAPVQITAPISGHFSQGVNIHTGPNGEVYFVCATNISGSPYTEDYLGFAKSTNGGANWTVNEQAIDVNGIRGNIKSSSIRVNSFPWMAVDKTGGPRNGWIYVTWAQKNLAPAGTDPDICFARSTNGGTNWSAPVRVNDDPINNGRDQWFSNVAVDAYGGINIIFYDSRNPTTNDSAECYVARSIDGGVTFTNIKVSDARFRPAPISGLAGGYQGDYIGIATGDNKVYPFWADNRTGTYQTWTAVIDLGPSINHTPLTNTEQTSGTRQVAAVITPAGSGINPSTVKLYYSKDNPVIGSNVTMTNSGGNNWTANLPLSGAGLYRYYLTCTDSLSRVATAPGGAPGNFYSFIASNDTVKPVITFTPLGDIPKTLWPATVSASVTDNIGVDSVWVRWYKNNTGTGIKHFKLNFVSGTNYSAVFNSLNSDVNFNDSIFYRVFARDNSSGHNADSTVLYKSKIINLVNACLGTGTASSNYPFTTFWMDGRTQMLFTAAELNAAGAGVNSAITKIGFNVITAASQTMNGFNVRFQHTTATSLTGFVSSGWTTAFTGTYSVPATGWQYIDMTSPYFVYNGTSNLLVEICYDNSSYTSYSPVYATANTGKTWGLYNDSGPGCTFGPGSAQANRPNTCFTMTAATGTGNNTLELPKTYSLAQNYPNPFNPVTKINFALPKQGFVSLKVYDVLGREVSTLVNEVKVAGTYSVDFDASMLSSGVYFYRLESGNFSDIKRMILVK